MTNDDRKAMTAVVCCVSVCLMLTIAFLVMAVLVLARGWPS